MTCRLLNNHAQAYSSSQSVPERELSFAVRLMETSSGGLLFITLWMDSALVLMQATLCHPSLTDPFAADL